MTTIEAQIAQQSLEDAAGESQAAPITSPAAQSTVDASTIKTPADLQTLAAQLAEKDAADTQKRNDDIETQIVRDEFGDQVHDPDKDAELGFIASLQIPTDAPPVAPTQPDKILPNRINTQQFAREEQEAIALKHLLETENPGQTYSLKDCLARVESKYAKAPDAAPAGDTAAPAAQEPELPRSLDELAMTQRESAKSIREKRLEIARADAELRYEDKLALTEELNALEERQESLAELAPQIAQRQEQQDSQFRNAYTASATKAVTLYPDAAKQGTAFHARMAEIDKALQESNDPRFHSAEKPLLIAQMVAVELNAAPARPTAANPQPPAVQYGLASTAHLAPPVASGSARTHTPTVPAIESEINSVRNPAQLEALRLSLLGPNIAR
jgi:hypothetical protein